MLNYEDVRKRMKDIFDIGDMTKASPYIVELNEIVTRSEAEDKAELDTLKKDIESKDNIIKDLKRENEEIRKANDNVMLKYGALVMKNPQPIVTEVETETEVKKSWEDIVKMD